MNTINLSGLRVLNTRPLKQSHELNHRIKQANGLPVSFPALEIISCQHWFHLLPNLDNVQQAIFTSANAVTCSFPIFSEKQVTWPEHIQNTAIGKGTAAALQSQHVRIDNIPEIADSEHLLMLNALQAIHNETILLFKGEGGRALIANTLIKRGARLIELNVYQRVVPDINREHLERLWRDECVDIILFTSQEAIRNIVSIPDKNVKAWLKRTPCLVISERLAQYASMTGIQNIAVCSPDSIIDALNQFNKGRTYGKY